jgi:hypothetical protein
VAVRGVTGADHRACHPVGEQAGRTVQDADQRVRLGASRGQAAQRVARRHHARHRLDAVPRDVAHHEQQVTVGQLKRVVPVARHRAVPGRAAAGRDVDAGGSRQADIRRHDRALQPQRQLAGLRDPQFAVREQDPGFGQGGPRLVQQVVAAAGGHRHPISGTVNFRHWPLPDVTFQARYHRDRNCAC